MKKLRVGVIYGGRSGEHEVSLASAAAVFKNLDPGRYEAVPIRIEKDGRWSLPATRADADLGRRRHRRPKSEERPASCRTTHRVKRTWWRTPAATR